jgi:hypothetical protein
MAKLWVPQRKHPEDRKHENIAELECPKCATKITTLNQHGWVICWSETLPPQGCGWFLRTYPGPFGKLMADAVLFVEPDRMTGRAPAWLVIKAMRMVTEYWEKHGIMQTRHSEDETAVRFAGAANWDVYNVAAERKEAEEKGLPTDDIR